MQEKKGKKTKIKKVHLLLLCFVACSSLAKIIMHCEKKSPNIGLWSYNTVHETES